MKLTVEMEVTEAQGLTLQAMFEYWNHLASVGSSRFVAFYADGDGDFHPECKVSFSEMVHELNDAMRRLAVVKDENGNRKHDFDRVGWYLHGPSARITQHMQSFPTLERLRWWIFGGDRTVTDEDGKFAFGYGALPIWSRVYAAWKNRP